MSTPPSTENLVSEMPSCKSCGEHIPRIGHNCKGLQFAKLNDDPSLEEVRVKLARLVLSLEDEIRSTYADLDEDGDQEIYSFDSGFIAGLRCALNGLANVRRSL